MAATINDVAKRAGVSIATVSRVIHSAGNVNSELTRKVQKSIEELGYVPNSIAQSLKQNCSKMIGITASDLSVAFFPEIVKGVEKVFLPRGYATIVSNTYDESLNERTILNHMSARRVDALLVNSTGQNEEMLENIARSKPVIFYDRRPVKRVFPAVYADKKRAMYVSLEHLAKMGHKRVMLASGPRGLNSNYDRYIGFQRYIFDHDLDPSMFSFRFGTFSFEEGVETMKAIMAMKERPTAVVTGSIAITAGIIDYCRTHGISIPDDMAIVSSGNFRYGDALDSGLTYLDDQPKEISTAVVELLERFLNGEKVEKDFECVLQPVLHESRSTGAAV